MRPLQQPTFPSLPAHKWAKYDEQADKQTGCCHRIILHSARSRCAISPPVGSAKVAPCAPFRCWEGGKASTWAHYSHIYERVDVSHLRDPSPSRVYTQRNWALQRLRASLFNQGRDPPAHLSTSVTSFAANSSAGRWRGRAMKRSLALGKRSGAFLSFLPFSIPLAAVVVACCTVKAVG